MTTSQASLRGARLDHDGVVDLLGARHQCVLSFLGGDGWPRGVVLSYLWRDGRFWLTAVAGRAHVVGMQSDPRVTVTVERHDAGRQMLAQRGRAVFHGDREVRARFYEEFAARHAPDTTAAFAAQLDTPDRVVVEIAPVGVPTTHDSRRLAGDGRGSRDLRADRRPR